MADVNHTLQLNYNWANLMAGVETGQRAFFRMSTATNQAVVQIRSLSTEARNVITVMAGMPAVAAGFGRFGTRVVDSTTEAVDSFAQFEQILLLTQFQGQLTTDQLAALRKEIMAVSAVTGFLTSDVAQAAKSFVASGFSAEFTRNALLKTAQFAQRFRGEISLQEAAELGIVGWSKYRKELASFDELLPLFGALGQVSRFQAGEILEFVRPLRSVSAQFPGNLRTILAMGAMLRNQGLTAAQAGDNIRILVEQMIAYQRALFAIENAGPRMSTRLKLLAGQALNLGKAFDEHGGIRPFLDTLRELEEGLGGMGSDAEKLRNLLTGLRTQAGSVLQVVAEAMINTREFGIAGPERIVRGVDALELIEKRIVESAGKWDDYTSSFDKAAITTQNRLLAARQNLTNAVGETSATFFGFFRQANTELDNWLARMLLASDGTGKFFASIVVSFSQILSMGSKVLDVVSQFFFAAISIASLQTAIKAMQVAGGLAAGATMLGTLSSGAKVFGPAAATAGAGLATGSLTGIVRGMAGQFMKPLLMSLGVVGAVGTAAYFLGPPLMRFISDLLRDDSAAPASQPPPATGYPGGTGGPLQSGAVSAPGGAGRTAMNLSINMDGRNVWQGMVDIDRREKSRDLAGMRGAFA